MEIRFTCVLLCPIVFSLAGDLYNDTEFLNHYDIYNETRKHYGMSYHASCGNYFKSFTCMSACKSIGYQAFRMDNKCKCTCHELKTTTILPFFKWQTNGTTPKLPRTQSIKLYHVVGTLSPQPTIEYVEPVDNLTSTTFDCRNFTMPPGVDANVTASGNETLANDNNTISTDPGNDSGNNGTDVPNGTGAPTAAAGGGPDKDAGGGADGATAAGSGTAAPAADASAADTTVTDAPTTSPAADS